MSPCSGHQTFSFYVATLPRTYHGHTYKHTHNTHIIYGASAQEFRASKTFSFYFCFLVNLSQESRLGAAGINILSLSIFIRSHTEVCGLVAHQHDKGLFSYLHTHTALQRQQFNGGGYGASVSLMVNQQGVSTSWCVLLCTLVLLFDSFCPLLGYIFCLLQCGSATLDS